MSTSAWTAYRHSFFYAFALHSVSDGGVRHRHPQRQRIRHYEHPKSVREKLHFKSLFKEELRIMGHLLLESSVGLAEESRNG